MEYVTNSPRETEDVGAQLAGRLGPGAVVAFTGDLGAGKTAFVRGMARGLGIEDRVGSLEAGKDADIVLTCGDPLVSDSRIAAVILNGQKAVG